MAIGTYPQVVCEVAFSSAPNSASPTWTDVSAYLLKATVTRGRQYELDRIEAGTMDVVFDNSDRRFDPTYPSSPYYPNVLPNKRIRLRALQAVPVNAASPLTTSGNEITDATRAAALSWTVAQSGGQTDGLQNDGSFFIGRAATNLFRRGQCDATTDTATFGSGTATAIAVDTTVAAPFSPQSIKATTAGDAANQGEIQNSATGQAAAAGTVGVGSVWFKGTAGNSYLCLMRWANTDASATSGTNLTFTATGAWQLLTPPSLAVATGKTGDLLSIIVRINGTRAETFNVAHAMLEKGQAVVAPYVATSGGTTATKNAARVQAPASLLDETTGWVAMRVRFGWGNAAEPGGGSGFPYLFAWGDDASNRIEGFYVESTNRIFLDRGVGSGAQVALAVNAGDTATLVFAWTATQLLVSVNGGSFTPTTNSSIPTLAASLFDIAANRAGGSSFNGDVLWFACGTGTLTDAGAAGLHEQLAAGQEPDASCVFFPSGAGVTAAWSASTSTYRVPSDAYVFDGFVERWPTGWDIGEYSEVDVTATDGFVLLQNTLATGTFSQDFSGNAVSALLTAAGWTMTTPSLETGYYQVPAQTLTAANATDALSAIQQVEDAELGQFFMSGAGVPTFLSRYHRVGLSPVATLTDADAATDATHINYSQIQPGFDLDLLLNDVVSQRSGGVVQEATDSTSISEYFRRAKNDTPFLTTDSDVLARAQFYVALFRQPQLRFEALAVDTWSDQYNWGPCLSADLGSPFTVVRSPQVGAGATAYTVTEQMFVERIQHVIEPPTQWTTTFAFSNAYLYNQFWVLGTGALASTTTDPNATTVLG